MVCPYCSNEMRRGKIIGERGGLVWIPYEKKISLLGFMHDADTKKLKNQKYSFFTFSSAEAYACENCGKLIAEI